MLCQLQLTISAWTNLVLPFFLIENRMSKVAYRKHLKKISMNKILQRILPNCTIGQISYYRVCAAFKPSLRKPKFSDLHPFKFTTFSLKSRIISMQSVLTYTVIANWTKIICPPSRQDNLTVNHSLKFFSWSVNPRFFK